MWGQMCVWGGRIGEKWQNIGEKANTASCHSSDSADSQLHVHDRLSVAKLCSNSLQITARPESGQDMADEL